MRTKVCENPVLRVASWGVALLCFLAANVQAQEAAATGGDLPKDYSCSLCHSKDGELRTETTPLATAEDLQHDIHWEKGLRCHDCHGGSPTLAEFKPHRNDPDFRSLTSPADVPGFCGHCHSNIEYMRNYLPSARTDQESEYWTSGHGRRLKAILDSQESDNPTTEQDKPETKDVAVATCVDCHGKHGILAVKNPDAGVYPTHVAETCARCHSSQQHMTGAVYQGHPLGFHQYEEWQQSVHAKALLEKGDLSAATCNDCHGNHGAMPPGVDSVANACGNCHGKIADLFSATNMKHKFTQEGLPGCATCHGTHRILPASEEMLGDRTTSVCFRCHNPEQPHYGAALAGEKMSRQVRAKLDELKLEISTAQDVIQDAERLGMEVRTPRYDLRRAVDSLRNARTQIHAFKPEPVIALLDEGYQVASDVRKRAEGALWEHTFRRIWLAGSLVPLLIVVCLLLLYIRRLGVPEPDA